MKKNSKIYVAGHQGLLGSAIVRQLQAQGFKNTCWRSHVDMDLTHYAQVDEFFEQNRPEYVFLAAARVGGVCSNGGHEAEFLRDNLLIQTNVIRAAHEWGVKKLLFTGSACVYPKLAPNPIREDSLLTGPLEPSNEWYAIAKIAGVKLCQAYWKQHGSCFISVMPTNLYGPNDHYDQTSSHVLPAMIRRFHEAVLGQEEGVTCWGTGSPTREFLYSDDCADACILAMKHWNYPDPVNIGTGKPISIRTLANYVADVVGFSGGIAWDDTKPDGTPVRQLDVSKIMSLGWKPKTGLLEGLRKTYDDFISHQIGPRRLYDNPR